MINFIFNTLKIIFLLGFLVFIHEGGHFIIAKLCKVRVKEFAIGFGPTIWKKQGKETRYALRLIPLGGFVNLEGEDEHSDDEKSFTNASIPKRIAIVAAGAIINIIFAIIVYFLLFAISGNNYTTIVDSTIPGYNAEIEGVIPGDEIIKINNTRVRVPSKVNEIINQNGEEEVELIIKRNNEYKQIKIKPTATTDETSNSEVMYYIGVQFKIAEKSIQNNLYYAGINTIDFLVSVVENVKRLFTMETTSAQMMGPIGISEVVSVTESVKEYIYIMALISISLGVTNLLPFPPLDGGKILFLIIEAIRRKPVKEEIELKVQLLGFAILMTLSLYIAYQDIIRIL